MADARGPHYRGRIETDLSYDAQLPRYLRSTAPPSKEKKSTVHLGSREQHIHRPKILRFSGAIICGIRRRSYMVKLSTERFLPGLSRVKILEQHVEYKLSKKGFSISSLWRDVGEGDGRWPPSKE